MKYVKLDFKDILFYAPNWSDAKGASYGHFTDFSSPTFEARKKIKVSGNPLNQKNMPTMARILEKFILRPWELAPEVSWLDSFHCTFLLKMIRCIFSELWQICRFFKFNKEDLLLQILQPKFWQNVDGTIWVWESSFPSSTDVIWDMISSA